MSAPLTGTADLLRFILRRDRIRLTVWLVGLGGLIAISTLVVPPLYDTPEKVAGYAATVGTTPVSHLMSGRQAGIDTLGGIVANEISQVAQLGICLMVVFLVIRHTRSEEETGRAELLRSTVQGRHAASLAALLYGMSASLVIGALTSLAMVAAGLDVVGSATYGWGLALLGVCYVAVSLVAAQLSASARGALALAGVAVATGYLVRGVGAMQDNALVWVSPFGWSQRMDAFGTEQWWPALLLLTLTAALLGLAGWLTAHRDFAGGLLEARLGPPRARSRLGTPLGLALHLQRGLLGGWAVGLAALGLLYGAVIPTIPELVASNPDIARVIGADAQAQKALIDAFLRYIFVFMAVISTGFAVASVLRLRSEEESGRSEMVLATSTRRTSWMAATLLVAGLGALLLALAMGLGLAVGYGLGMGDWGQVTDQLGGQLSYLPAVLLVAAVAAALAGWVPRWSPLAWVAVAFVFFEVMLGEALRVPRWVAGISPFWHLPQLPVENFTVLPFVTELALATTLALVALWGYRRRDVTTG